MTITLPSVTNPGVAFTRNSYEIMQSITKCFNRNTRQLIPYKEFQRIFMESDPKGDSKIRMLFPLLRKAGCIYPDQEGSVEFKNGTFFTQLGVVFNKISGLYWEAVRHAAAIETKDHCQAALVLQKARKIYFGVSKVLFDNLCEVDKGYRYLLSFVGKYAPVTKDEVWVLLYLLEKSSPITGSIEDCSCDEGELARLMNLIRGNNLELKAEKANNAVSYFMSVLKTLLIVESTNGAYVLTKEAETCLKGSL